MKRISAKLICKSNTADDGSLVLVKMKGEYLKTKIIGVEVELIIHRPFVLGSDNNIIFVPHQGIGWTISEIRSGRELATLNVEKSVIEDALKASMYQKSLRPFASEVFLNRLNKSIDFRNEMSEDKQLHYEN